MSLPRLALTAGEPAGIGPDLCLKIAAEPLDAAVVVLGDPQLLRERAEQLGLSVAVQPVTAVPTGRHQPGTLPVLPVPLAGSRAPGQLDTANAAHVLALLEGAARGCLQGEFDAVVTAPVHKGVINEAGHVFSGHTEFFAEQTGGQLPVMMLAADTLRVALVTTHLPLRAVADAITAERLERVITTLDRDLRARFGIQRPCIRVCGLNPHAGEGGHLGREEIEVIEPVLARLRDQGLDLDGPLPADTVFTPRHLAGADAILAMYHDQGLPVLKHAGFGRAVNITLGLPIIRTSVDHGTALDLAGTGQAEAGSLLEAIAQARRMALATQSPA
ncbi:4-hydroxythreonine-4-phosphate dehydrogenase [Alkalispirillum mobile]|uniref:4-hydroxythreonine-4-phosphate dehydrogenase n=1 Tax=Alkalispirillum mobile TaxID=85925 RepID=A0A498CE03_9GAMM|nr:4-hydroxythreonine-4-phosphate dehydrogenase PdxA [Alkalispirillum mobile]RLK51550.1 4-hydroxythreonine-4-phosphate dehydrogenase [Alkalispirillum mobile]